jgi:hypothetical protein
MERPTDTFKETHNLRLAPRDTWFGGQVSNLQVSSSATFYHSLKYLVIIPSVQLNYIWQYSTYTPSNGYPSCI